MGYYYAVLWLSIWFFKTAAQDSYQIEDIPIEHYVHEDIQHDEIDVELMPRSPKKLLLSKDKPSDVDFEETRHIKYYFEDLPYRIKQNQKARTKRDVLTKKSQKIINQEIGQPLELVVIDTENVTEKIDSNLERIDKELDKNVLINDFLKFKRSVAPNTETGQTEHFRRKQIGGKFLQSLPQPSLHSHTLKALPNKPNDATRKTRGAVKEQWVKQAQLVRQDEHVYEDNIQLSSDAARAPRAHFVTNGMSEREPLEYKFNREPRSEGTNKYLHSDLPAEMDYYQPRFARNYVSRGDRYTGYNNYNRYPTERRNYYRGQEYSDKPLNYNADYNEALRKRRIIYYATLPEAPRNVRNDELRQPYDRYSRDRFDYRYSAPELFDTYRKRHPDPSRYDVNVSTGVNVREVKKNPERRIYSDVDRKPYPPEN